MTDAAPAINVTDISQNPGSAAGTTSSATSSGNTAGGAGSTATATPAAPPTTAHDWTAGLDEDSRGYVTNKGFKTPADVLKSYRNAETLLGVPADNVLKLPTKDDDAEGWNKVYGRLGRPEKADDYKIPMPEKGGDPEFAKWAKDTFHKHGISAKQAEKLAADFNQYAEATNGKVTAAEAARVAFDEPTLKREWGMAYEKNMQLVDRAAIQLGIDNKQLLAIRNAMGANDAMKFMHNVAAKLGGEDSFIGGGGKSSFDSVLTPSAALNKIAALKQDQGFIQKLMNGDTEANQEFTKLHQWAHPEDLS